EGGLVVRAFHPSAEHAELLLGGEARPMKSNGAGGFWVVMPDAKLPLRHQIRFRFGSGQQFTQWSPYQFAPTVGDLDQHLFNEGRHRRLWEMLGARTTEIDGISGVAFSVWAPNAKRVSVVGDFCQWDGRHYPMRAMGSSGIFEVFIPGLESGGLYKFEIRTAAGHVQTKTDPMARAMEHPPQTASVIHRSGHRWNDHDWMDARPTRLVLREPLAIYEMHLGSWKRDPSDPERLLSLRAVARELLSHVKDHGFNAIELMPITEFPFDGSWGYQVSGYFSPSARFGTPDDFKWFIDQCHQAGVAVLIDWVPAHFPRDAFALASFDGSSVDIFASTPR
ncbi:MAG: alpha-amylase family glycosyl hydrolase, partial [Myxococcota bacterium]